MIRRRLVCKSLSHSALAAFCCCLFLISGCAVLDSLPDRSPSPSAENTTAVHSAAPPVDKDIFQRIREGFSMPDIEDGRVLRHQEAYLASPGSFRKMIERSRPYLHYIIGEIEKRGMPTELALLPMVESAYNPKAYSRSKASGLWQFIPATGRYYKLAQTWWQDDRRDILASTAAALDYFEALYGRHGDWHLALASYNWGSGAVGKAVVKNQKQGLPADYQNLASMPEETRNYIPKLQALENIVRDPRLLAALNIPPIPDRPYFSVVAPIPNADIRVLAQLAEISEEEFIALNPAHHRPVIVSGTSLLLPENQVDIFEKNIRDYLNEGHSLSSWQIYTLRQEEQIDAVAKRFGMTLSSLIQVNDIDTRFDPRPGMSLLVFGSTGGEPLNEKTLSRSLRFPESERNNGFVNGCFYTIRKGDTLPRIARLTGFSVHELRRHNRLRGDLIIAGKQLILPRPAARMPFPGLRPGISGTVSPERPSGEPLLSIAR